MITLRAIDLVDVWEQADIKGAAERAHLLLCRVHPDRSDQELESLPLGIRNDMLLHLREQIFGTRLESVVRCSNCHESLEVNVDIHELQTGAKLSEASVTEWTTGDLWVRYRVPTGRDLRDLEGYTDQEMARQRLLEGCIVEAQRGEEIIQPSQLTQEETTALAECVAQADPHGELMLNGECPNCGQTWETLLDIASFLWHELEIHVKRLLTEVHALAWAYSWNERDILTMTARRRQIYLELLGQ